MTPDLIALLLRESIPVRLALLDAGIDTLGWPVSGTYRSAGNPIVLEPAGAKQFREDVERFGSAWLPANPLAIVEHAARERGLDCAPTMSRTPNGWRFALVVEGQHGQDVEVESASGPCHHTAAIALLREVVGC